MLDAPPDGTTIEKAPGGHLLRCSRCDETYLIEAGSQGVPLWAFESLAKGFMLHHHDCEDPDVN